MFKKKEDQFFIHLANISANLTESMNYFTDYRLTDVEGLKVFSEKMKEYETKGDSLVHQVILDLNNVFITPIEREDILALAMNMDDVLDGLEQTAALLDMYGVTTADEYMHQFVEAIQKCVIEIEGAIGLLSPKTLPSIRNKAIKIKDYESQCDTILRVSIKHLFQTEKDPIRIIQYKEIYEELEEVADYCENVANTFEAIIMKNA
ncbi:hypothetical protein ACA30_17020 [Virgibacillus soli]|uniref:Phosphate transport regulator n=1 Tax=Lederbergia galactosidilytica TaxID=217031 RepID=A0A0Q9XW61_9BACI|nr:DUF47 domain-containing protein [Lederbergia galactosidilytica]KRG12653.1 hypothetical protein ACA29_10695 [Lederbergia galactosidilytica]KRG13002.1 hypothetical protein ACA30_17020 [Virgibacillus soli]MBP1917063.1 putative phosphate transport protein (TIGR00153 family) [Lederbergia galactosidilytica]